MLTVNLHTPPAPPGCGGSQATNLSPVGISGAASGGLTLGVQFTALAIGNRCTGATSIASIGAMEGGAGLAAAHKLAEIRRIIPRLLQVPIC